MFLAYTRARMELYKQKFKVTAKPSPVTVLDRERQAVIHYGDV